MNINKIYFFYKLIGLLLLNTCAFSQMPIQKFKHLTRDNGLSSNRVNFIAEDNLGFIWFGTEDGLNKFDGYDFYVYRNQEGNSESIPDNSIDFILEDTIKNNLWLATRKGLVYFDRIHQTFKLVLGRELEDTETGNVNITSLCFDHQKNLWIATFNGLFVWNQEQNRLIKLRYTSKNGEHDGKAQRIYCLYNDSYNQMWLGYEKGLLQFNNADSSFSAHLVDRDIQAVMMIRQDHEKNYWIGSDNSGLYYCEKHPKYGVSRHFNKEKGNFIVNRVHGIIEDEPGKYYIIVRDGGLYYFDKISDKLTYFGHDIYNTNTINSAALISGFKSANGIVWLGTYNSGVNYIDKEAKKFEHYKVNFKPDGLFNNNIRALLEDTENKIWIGTKEGGGLSVFNKETGLFKNYPKTLLPGGLNDDYVFSICELDNNQLLIGTFRNGVALFNKKSERFTYFTQSNNPKSLSDNRVYSIYKDIQGIIWVGNYANLQQFNLRTKEFITLPDIKRPRCFLDEDQDRIWIGSKEHGLYLLNKISGRHINFLHDATNPKSISSNDIYALQKDSKGNLWVGTKQGVNKYDAQKNEFIRFTETDGLPANWICALLIDNSDNIWVSSTNGISKFNTQNRVFHNYDVKDGLQGNEFEGYVALKTKDGHMLFGGRNGFNMFLPPEITDNKKIPEIVITGFKLFNKEIPVSEIGSPLQKHISFTDRITLKHNQSAITIEYVALNFTSPEKNQYAYKLVGFNHEWIQAGTNRSAVYTNVPPGKYTFWVRGSNNDNLWNNEGKKLEIIILNPFWKTIWAYIIYVLVLGTLIYYVRKILIYRIKQHNLLKFERLDKQRIQEMNQLKLRFFTNISHEFRTPLTLISGPLAKLMSYKNDNDEQKYLYRIMQNNVQRLLALVNELMDFRKAEHGKLQLHVIQCDMVVFLQQIIDCFEDKALEKNISFSFEYPLNTDFDKWFDKNIIDKVIFNLLSNAFKHTPNKGHIKVLLTLDSTIANITVTDSGKGIPKEKLDLIFERFYQVEDATQTNMQGTGIGLAFSKRLMELHHGKIEVESRINTGTTFTISFPVSKAAYSESELAKIPSALIYSEPENHQMVINSKAADIVENKNYSHKILIVEDNKDLLEFLNKSFTHYEVLTAVNGKEGYRLANEKIPDLVISDIMMPEMNGLEMCKKLKTHFATSHIPVILLTAKTEISQKIEGIETGADAYIEKPFDIKYLEAQVKNLLLQRKALRKRYANEPDVEIQELALNMHEKKFMDKTTCLIEANINNPDFSVETLGFELGLSRSQLFRKFKSIYELKPSEFIRNERLKYAKKLLLEGNYNVNEIADLVGFKSASYFITSFKKYYGKTPVEFINKS